MLTIIKQAFLVEKKGKKDMVLVDVRVTSLMEDKRNQLVLNQSKFDSLKLALKQEQAKADLDASYVQTLSPKIRMQRGIIGYYKSAINESNSKFEKIHKEATTSRNLLEYNHYICDYMQLLVICNYIWTFLQLFLVLVIFAITLQLVCDYFGVHPSL